MSLSELSLEDDSLDTSAMLNPGASQCLIYLLFKFILLVPAVRQATWTGGCACGCGGGDGGGD